METASASLRPVHAGTRTAQGQADDLLPPAAFADTRIARLPGLRFLGRSPEATRRLRWWTEQESNAL